MYTSGSRQLQIIAALLGGVGALHNCNGVSVASIVASSLSSKYALVSGSEQEIKGGITNILWKIQLHEAGSYAPSTPALVRCYGENTDLLINRRSETEVLIALSSLGFEVALLGTFKNGRIERWLEGRALEVAEIRSQDISDAIAVQLARLHSKNVALLSFPNATAEKPMLLPTLHKWIDLALKAAVDIREGNAVMPVTPARRAALDSIDVEHAAAEVRELMREFETILLRVAGDDRAANAPFEVVFGHNDLLASNIILVDDPAASAGSAATAAGPTIRLIDFEYSAYTFRAFDLANHFQEWAGFETDWSALPSEATRRRFLRQYLSALLLRDDAPTDASGGDVEGDVELERAVDALAEEVRLFAIFSDAYWGMWAIIQQRHSAIEFDFIGYSERRFARFAEHREAAVRRARAYFLQGVAREEL
jgi:ethanolamine kinase